LYVDRRARLDWRAEQGVTYEETYEGDKSVWIRYIRRQILIFMRA